MRSILMGTAASLAVIAAGAAAAQPGDHDKGRGSDREPGGRAAVPAVRAEAKAQANAQRAEVKARANAQRAEVKARIADNEPRIREPQTRHDTPHPDRTPPRPAPAKVEHKTVVHQKVDTRVVDKRKVENRTVNNHPVDNRRVDARQVDRRDIDNRKIDNSRNVDRSRQVDRSRVVDNSRVVNTRVVNNRVTINNRTVIAARPLRKDIKRVSYAGPRGRKIYVPTNDRVRVVTQRRAIDWAALDRRVSYDGCPPGLARKYNGCTPPGLVRPPARQWVQPDWYWHDYDRNVRYRYSDGYMLRLGAGTSVVSYVPLLGGALAVGQAWPTRYDPVPVPSYYDRYYDLGDSDRYRYYGDTIYRVDPGTQAITAVAALLTGNAIEVGQPMPAGYDVYNVPYDYRDQYVDGPDAYYRYSDGYVYQLDPTTRLVQAAIELLA